MAENILLPRFAKTRLKGVVNISSNISSIGVENETDRKNEKESETREWRFTVCTFPFGMNH